MPAVPFQDRASKSGLTVQLVRDVVVAFYGKVRRDAVLGPIFEEAIGRNWDFHIERIIQFWLTVTRLERGYDAKKFMPAHLKHQSIQIDLIPRWLELFREAATENCSSPGASILIDIAERMAETLELSLKRRGDGCSSLADNDRG